MPPANVPIGNTGFAGKVEAAGIEPANDSYRLDRRLLHLVFAVLAVLAAAGAFAPAWFGVGS